MSFRISVIIPTYNRAALISATLDAVLTQTLQPDEVIVVDDGSTDETSEILARYIPCVRSISIVNAGDTVARNTGLRAATGDLVAFCDSDDLWCPGMLAAIRCLWQSAPGLHAAYTNFVILREGAWAQRGKFADAPSGYWDGLRWVGADKGVFDLPLVDRLIRFQPFFPSCMAVDRQWFLGLGGWDESVGRTIGTDFATALRVAEHPPIGVIHLPLVGIRKHVGNYSADTMRMSLGDATILEHVLHHRPSLAPYAQQIRKSIELRRAAALELAFARCELDAVCAIAALLPENGLSAKLRLKAKVAELPHPLRKVVTKALLAFGSLRSA